MSRWFGAALVAFMLFATCYPSVVDAREVLNDEVRAGLLRSGEAQQFVKVSAGTMHVRVTGSANGPVVLLVHGGVVGGFGFEHWRKPLADAGFRVIVPDLLGYGYSDRPNVPYTKEFYVTQLGELLDALGVNEPVRIVGASMGGAIVTAFAAHSPKRVSSVALMAPSGGGRVSIVNPILLWPIVGDLIFWAYGPKNMRDMMDKAYINSPDRDAMAKWMTAQTRYSGFGEGALNNLRNFDASWQPADYEALGRSGLPVLAVWGTVDTVNPFEQSNILLGHVPQMKVVPLQGKGHAITFGETGTVLPLLLDFWAAG